MKTKLTIIIALISILLIDACKGPEGPQGPIGPNGPIGPTGQTGPNGSSGTNGATGATGATGAKGDKGDIGAAGANGNANVVYSEWKSLRLDRTADKTQDIKGNYTSLTLVPLDTSEPLFTKDAINTAAIFSYVKYNVLVPNGYNSYGLVERIKLITFSNFTQTYYLIPGRNKDNSNSYSFYYFNTLGEYGENYFFYQLTFSFYEPNSSTAIPIPEFQGKDLAYFQNAAKTTPLIRHVVVYGSTKGRMASIDMSDYNEVKRAFNLPN